MLLTSSDKETNGIGNYIHGDPFLYSVVMLGHTLGMF